MKILFVTHRYPPSVGGMEKQSYELIEGLKPHADVLTLIYNGQGSHLWFLVSLRYRLRKILKAHQDITHIHFNDGFLGWWAASVRKRTNARIYATMHGLDAVYPMGLYQRLMKRFLFNNVDELICVSRATAEEVITRGFPEEKTAVVPNGVDHEMAHINSVSDFKEQVKEKFDLDLERRHLLLSLGRSVKRKGFSWFIRNVLPLLPDNVTYCILGPVPSHPRLLFFLRKFLPGYLWQLIVLMGIGSDYIDVHDAIDESNGRVFHLGKLPFDEMVQFLRHADLFIMPNIKVHGDAEGFGLVALEAALSGTVVTASRLEGITEAIVHEKNGVLVEPEAPQEWKETISELLDSADSRNRMAEEFRKYAIENYSWKKMAQGYLTRFQQEKHDG